MRGDREILTSGSDGTPRLWDGLTGRLERVLRCLPLRFDEKIDVLVEQVPCSPP